MESNIICYTNLWLNYQDYEANLTILDILCNRMYNNLKQTDLIRYIWLPDFLYNQYNKEENRLFKMHDVIKPIIQYEKIILSKHPIINIFIHCRPVNSKLTEYIPFITKNNIFIVSNLTTNIDLMTNNFFTDKVYLYDKTKIVHKTEPEVYNPLLEYNDVAIFKFTNTPQVNYIDNCIVVPLSNSHLLEFKQFITYTVSNKLEWSINEATPIIHSLIKTLLHEDDLVDMFFENIPYYWFIMPENYDYRTNHIKKLFDCFNNRIEITNTTECQQMQQIIYELLNHLNENIYKSMIRPMIHPFHNGLLNARLNINSYICNSSIYKKIDYGNRQFTSNGEIIY